MTSFLHPSGEDTSSVSFAATQSITTERYLIAGSASKLQSHITILDVSGPASGLRRRDVLGGLIHEYEPAA